MSDHAITRKMLSRYEQYLDQALSMGAAKPLDFDAWLSRDEHDHPDWERCRSNLEATAGALFQMGTILEDREVLTEHQVRFMWTHLWENIDGYYEVLGRAVDAIEDNVKELMPNA